MSNYPVVSLPPHKTEAVKRFHPWIFSGAIFKKEASVTEGNLVEVQDTSGNFLAIGYYSNGSIAVRILSFSPIVSLEQLWIDKIQSAYKEKHRPDIQSRDQCLSSSECRGRRSTRPDHRLLQWYLCFSGA